MTDRFKDWLLAIVGGVLLALMISCNSLLTKHTTPVFASWVAHGIGAIIACVLVMVSPRLFQPHAAKPMVHSPTKVPLWFFLGGIPGAFTVILAAIAVNGSLSLSGTISFMLVGQIVFGVLSDHFGLLHIPKRRLQTDDLWVVLCVLAGSAMIIFGGDHP